MNFMSALFPDVSTQDELELHRLTITKVVGRFLLAFGVGGFAFSVFSEAHPVGIILNLAFILFFGSEVINLTLDKRQYVDNLSGIFCVFTITIVIINGFSPFDLLLIIIPIVFSLFLASEGLVRNCLLGLSMLVTFIGLYYQVSGGSYMVSPDLYLASFFVHLFSVSSATAIVMFLAIEYHMLVIRSSSYQNDQLTRKVEEKAAANAILSKYGGQLMLLKADSDQQLLHDRQAVAELQASNEQLEQFSYAASHDLKEPVRTINSFMQIAKRNLIKSGELDEELKEYFDHVVDSSQSMNFLLDRLLCFSRIERHKLTIDRINLFELLNTKILIPSGDKHDNSTLSLECDVSIMMETDATLLVSSLKELINNAFKFVKSDVVPQVEIVCQEVGENISIKVVDNGIGIDPKYFGQIFNIFKRLHARGVYSGPGIGLALAKRSIGLVGGDISITESSANGSTFCLTLPKVTVS